MVGVGAYTLVDAPTFQVAAAAACVHMAASLGSCRDDILEASAGLVHIVVLVALQHWAAPVDELEIQDGDMVVTRICTCHLKLNPPCGWCLIALNPRTDSP